MAKNFIQNGDAIHVTAKSLIKGGDLLFLGDIAGVAIADIPQGEIGAVSVIGVWAFPAKSADSITQGTKVYWDDTEKAITTTKGSNKVVGVAWTDSPATVATVTVRLNG